MKKRKGKKNTGSRSFPPAPWWDEECSKSVEQRKQALKLFRSNPSYVNFLNLRRQEAITKRTLRSAKREGWRAFCESITPLTNICSLWNMIKRFKNRFLGSSNPTTSSNFGFPPKILNQISNICPPPTCLHMIHPSTFDSQDPPSCKIFDTPFQIEELDIVIQSIKRKKSSPGIDQINYKMLSQLPSEYYSLLLSTLNSIFSSGSFPESWRHSLVYFIPSPANSVQSL